MTNVLKSRVIGTAIGVIALGLIAGAVAGMGGRDAAERGPVTEEFSDQVEWVSVDGTLAGPIEEASVAGRVWIEAVIFGPSIARILIEDESGADIAMSPVFHDFGPGPVAQEPIRIDLGIAADGIRIRSFAEGTGFSGPVTVIYRRSLTGPARADVTTSNTNPGDPGYGRPDGVVDAADLTFFVEQWIGGPVA